MFHPSSQHVSFRQQIIALSQSYPCPRCSSGMMEPFGLAETFRCTTCRRNFVALKGGRLLYPAENTGWRIAPTYWWDGFRWHWAGTTASSRQLLTIVIISLLPVIMLNMVIRLNVWSGRPDWCNPFLISLLLGLASTQLVYLLCWDFEFLSKRRS